MLKLICGPDRAANSERILSEIRERAAQGCEGMILIVPEQYSHETERSLCAACGDTVSRFAEVLSFTRLASRVFSLYGGVCGEYLDEGGKLLTLYRAAQQVREQLKYYASAMTRPEFLRQLGALMEELMTGCVTPEELAAVSERLSGQLAQKTLELSILYESYLSVCKTGRDDPVTRQTRLLELLIEEPYLDGREVYLDGFSDFTPLQKQLVSAILRRAAEVTVSILSDGSGNAAFQTGRDTAKTLRQIAGKLEIPVHETPAAPLSRRAAGVQAWLDGLFSGGRADARIASCVEAVSASSVRQACALGARLVRDHAAEGGRLRSVTVCVTDWDAYEPELRELFARAGIPAYFSGARTLADSVVVTSLLGALQAVRRYETAHVIAYLKSPLCPLAQDDADRLEQYAVYWSVSGSLWERPWQMHPRGLGFEMEPEDEKLLAQLNAWREEAIAPLHALRLALESAQNASAQAQAVADFLSAAHAMEFLQRETQRLEAEGAAQRAQQCRKTWEVLVSVLEQIHAVLGDTVLDADVFRQVLAMLAAEAAVGTIPASCDEVQVTTLPMLRHKVTGTLILLGAEEGRFPEFPDRTGLLAESERTALRAAGLELSPEQDQRMDRELGWVLAALSSAMDRVILVSASAQPSYLFEKTRALIGAPEEPAGEEHVFYADENDCAAAILQQGDLPLPPDAPQEACRALLSRCRFSPQAMRPGTVRALYGTQLELSASRIDRFAACRYAYFLQYGLRAKPWKQAQFDASLFGTFVHAVLQYTVNDVMALGGFSAVSDETVGSIASGHMRAYLDNELKNLAGQGSRERYLSERNLEEAAAIVRDVANELRRSEFRPVETELAFRRGAVPGPVEIRAESGTGWLSGIVDRVDAYDDGNTLWYRVVDYKTGRKDFDYSEILCGENLQMILYSSALRGTRRPDDPRPLTPAGVLYVPGRYGMVSLKAGEEPETAQKERQKSLRRKGVILGAEPVLSAMESSDGQPQYMPYSNKKDGPAGNLVTERQLAALERYAVDSVRAMIDAMLSGSVLQNPIVRGPSQSACQYCDFRAACHKDAWKIQPRSRRRVTKDEFWDQVEGGASDG